MSGQAWSASEQTRRAVSGKNNQVNWNKVPPDIVTNVGTRSRTYKLKEFMKPGWLDIVKDLFKTVDIAQQSVLKGNDGSLSRSLYLHFDDSSEAEQALEDYNKAARFSIELNQNKYNLIALSNDETDGHGTFIPRVIKQVFIRDCPFGLVKNKDLLVQTFGDYFDFDFENNPPTLVRRNGVFNGSCHVIVKDYKMIPARSFQIPMVKWCDEKREYIFDSSIGTRLVRVECRGYDPTNGKVIQQKIGGRCRFCGKNGHFGRDCEHNNLRDESKFNGYYLRCPECKSDKNGCTKKIGERGWNFPKLIKDNPTPGEAFGNRSTKKDEQLSSKPKNMGEQPNIENNSDLPLEKDEKSKADMSTDEIQGKDEQSNELNEQSGVPNPENLESHTINNWFRANPLLEPSKARQATKQHRMSTEISKTQLDNLVSSINAEPQVQPVAPVNGTRNLPTIQPGPSSYLEGLTLPENVQLDANTHDDVFATENDHELLRALENAGNTDDDHNRSLFDFDEPNAIVQANLLLQNARNNRFDILRSDTYGLESLEGDNVSTFSNF